MRILYKLFQRRFERYMVEDFLASVPDDILDPALKVMDEQGRKLEKLFKYMGSELHHKMVEDAKNYAHYRGMLVQLKILTTMIQRIPDLAKKKVEAPKENIYDKAMAGLEKFKGLLSTPKSSTDE